MNDISGLYVVLMAFPGRGSVQGPYDRPPRYKMPPQSLDRRGFPEDAPAQTSELGGVTTSDFVGSLSLFTCTDL